MKECLGIVSIVLLATLHASAALAWGAEGHQIIAHIAASKLTPRAQAEVSQLLGGNTETAMVQASTWADEIRPSRRETAPWHFVDIPIGSSGYDASRDCVHDDCVVAQIIRDESVIADRRLVPAVRAEALKFLIHFVGDIHQPLHASNNHDR
ncbi:MAG TPA: S1/P1 nuclease, partial [Rhizomicrobium sp.]|nr:S1/P1 nuclease [Rhizomicrobium sp.]